MPENNFHVYEKESWIGNIWKVFFLCFRMNPEPSTLIRQKPSRQKNFKYCSREGLSASISMKTLMWRSGVPTMQSTKIVSVITVCNGEWIINLTSVHYGSTITKGIFPALKESMGNPSPAGMRLYFCNKHFVTNFTLNFWLAICIFKGGSYIVNRYVIIQKVWLTAYYSLCVRHIDT